MGRKGVEGLEDDGVGVIGGYDGWGNLWMVVSLSTTVLLLDF